MKATLTTTVKTLLADRLLTAVILLLLIACGVYCLYVGISLRPSELQVAVHYTAYGTTGFYRDKWYYFANFIALGVVIAIVHTALIAKFHLQGRREMAFLFAWMSLLLIVIAFFMTHAVLKVAFL